MKAPNNGRQNTKAVMIREDGEKRKRKEEKKRGDEGAMLPS